MYMSLTEKRIQIYLPERDYEAIKRRAQAEGKSFAQIVRQAAERYLRSSPESDLAEGYKSLLAGAGLLRDDSGDVSEKHDEHLGKGRW